MDNVIAILFVASVTAAPISGALVYALGATRANRGLRLAGASIAIAPFLLTAALVWVFGFGR